ncbi:Surface layer protein A [Corynebacterium kutscheri]|uniref:Putative esterase n=1 Tax=Corynebacterium kutscheri TaxID=35755 RepID=A0A0F6TD71_9CORY|nr:alpha/beta hydrolase family protein [Corynebacterium kutscheri]AKE40996.1 putative esterase [Corynebacterium kutscheri]VEH06878.1 Surface layer protein A [Corynebacterium kutscheri]VEH09294.1 Surface layer protein A [Corynebacterium kutscheri]VEH79382.1 Surface layer protein A [Corynebacterium kutscheri]
MRTRFHGLTLCVALSASISLLTSGTAVLAEEKTEQPTQEQTTKQENTEKQFTEKNLESDVLPNKDIDNGISASELLNALRATAEDQTPEDLTPVDVPEELKNVFKGKATIENKQLPPEFSDENWRELITEFNKKNPGRVEEVTAYSPSMEREIPLVLIKASKPHRPTIYLMNGAGGGEQAVNWIERTDAMEFYTERDVNVVIPMRGAFSYYTDWITEPQGNEYLKGKQYWETFLSKELPEPIEDYLKANGQRGIIGMSMSATSSILIAEHNPGFYNAVGSFSGCVATARPLPRLYVNSVLKGDGVTPEQMWGTPDSEVSKYNDGIINAEGLRGSEIYVANASGLISQEEMFNKLYQEEGETISQTLITSSVLAVEGGVIEAASNACTHHFKTKLDKLGIPADFNFRPTGIHTWTYWERDLRASWPTFARAFGLENEPLSEKDQKIAESSS